MLLFGGYLTAIHMVFPGSIRYRLPLEPFLIVIAAAALSKLADRFSRHPPPIEDTHRVSEPSGPCIAA